MKQPIYIKIPESFTMEQLAFVEKYTDTEIICGSGVAFIKIGEIEGLISE